VHKQGPSVLDATAPPEAAFRAAEGLALEHILCESRAVDGQKPPGPPGVLVNGPGHELLARVALAGDQHRCLAGGHGADGLADVQYLRTRPDDLGHADIRLLGHYGRRHRPRQAVGAHGIGGRSVELQLVHGLADEVVGALSHGLGGQGIVAHVRDDDDRRVIGLRRDLPQQVDTRRIGQLLIQQNGIGRFLLEQLPGLLRSARDACAVPQVFEVHCKQLAEDLVVLDDQDVCHVSSVIADGLI